MRNTARWWRPADYNAIVIAILKVAPIWHFYKYSKSREKETKCSRKTGRFERFSAALAALISPAALSGCMVA